MTRIIGGVISNNPASPLYKWLWLAHRVVIQIIKHNGDNDAFPKPRFLPVTTAVGSTRPADPPLFIPPSPLLQLLLRDEPHVPSSSSWGRARAELLGWIISFPRAFRQEENLFYFQKDLGMSQAPSVSPSYHVPWRRASHLRAFHIKRVRGSSSFLPLTWVKVG